QDLEPQQRLPAAGRRDEVGRGPAGRPVALERLERERLVVAPFAVEAQRAEGPQSSPADSPRTAPKARSTASPIASPNTAVSASPASGRGRSSASRTSGQRPGAPPARATAATT